jgi:signal transduction histidine kinase
MIRSEGRAADGARPLRWSTVPLVLVVVVLLGSVLVPARETWRIMHLLRETTDVIEPARLIGARLEYGLTVESAALESYAVSGDSIQLARYTAEAAEDDRRLSAIQDLARKLDADAVDRVATVRRRLGEWREVGHGLAEGRIVHARLASAIDARQASYEDALREVARLASYLAAAGTARREVIHSSERLGLVVNASLVLIALAAVLAVASLSHRERRLTLILERRIDEEAALRRVARELGAVNTSDDVMRQVVEGALATTRASGAYVECIVSRAPTDTVEFVAQDRGHPPSRCLRKQRTTSAFETISGAGAPGTLTEVDSVAEWLPSDLIAQPDSHTGLLAPLSAHDRTLGVLVLLRERASPPFDGDTRRQLHTLADLASAALQRVAIRAAERSALDEARDGRAELERVMKSRSRLMRGFSHDVKNPLGAADGYAELLTTGIYGTLSTEQTERVECIRRSIRVALALIDDLHQLARAEAGRLELSIAPVDLGDLARASGDEYRASAETSGLSLSIDVPVEPVVVATDSARIRQIVSNLLSNAIKYTRCGSITLRVGRWPLRPRSSADGWAAIDVIDSGPGIPPDKRDTIFEEFTRLAASEAPGAGLGLAISQRLAHALGGQITLESEVGTGSTFTLWLPLEYPRSRVQGAGHHGPHG